VGVFGVLNLRIWRQSQRQSKQDKSPLMASQARLFFARALSDFFTLATLLISIALAAYPWAAYIDPLASLLIAIAIMVTAWGIFSGSVKDLLDRTLEEEDQLVIMRELARHFDDFRDLKEIRSRRAGSRCFIEISLDFDPQWRVGQAQQAAAKLTSSLQEAIPNSVVTIALAPVPRPDDQAEPASPM
jgi:divalent metal cation (Fe/Co/Zn/Cd) transporter